VWREEDGGSEKGKVGRGDGDGSNRFAGPTETQSELQANCRDGKASARRGKRKRRARAQKRRSGQGGLGAARRYVGSSMVRASEAGERRGKARNAGGKRG